MLAAGQSGFRDPPPFALPGSRHRASLEPATSHCSALFRMLQPPYDYFKNVQLQIFYFKEVTKWARG